MPEQIGQGIVLYSAEPLADSHRTVVAVPPAGTGAQFFQPWLRSPRRRSEVVVVQLPGRGSHLLEPPVSSLQSAAAEIAKALSTSQKQTVLFGHSMGAWLAYEIALALTAIAPDHVPVLTVSACPAPGQPLRAIEGINQLADEQFLDAVGHRFGEIEAVRTTSPPVRKLVLQTMRNDLALCESYLPTEVDAGPRTFRVDTFVGVDDQAVSEAAVLGWSAIGGLPGKHRRFPGGHMYIKDHLPEVLHALEC